MQWWLPNTESLSRTHNMMLIYVQGINGVNYQLASIVRCCYVWKILSMETSSSHSRTRHSL